MPDRRRTTFAQRLMNRLVELLLLLAILYTQSRISDVEHREGYFHGAPTKAEQETKP